MATPTSEENHINVLLIGETGVGKTSLVEIFINYGEQTGKEFKLEDIKEFLEPRKGKDKMESDTSTAKSYKIQPNELELNIIDTPGLVDSRGEDTTKNNIDKIISTVQSLDYLNCICLVFNGTIARISTLVEFVIKEILKLVPSSVLNNVIVIFTKTSDALALNFELEALTPYGLEVPAEHSFMLENPFCRWKKAKEFGILKEESNALKKAFSDTFKLLDKIVETACTFKPVAAKKFGELHKIIGTLEQDISHLRLYVVNKFNHQKAIDEAKQHISTKERLKEALLKLEETEKIEMSPTEESNIICLTCSSNCHLQCHCTFTGGIFGNVRACTNFKKAICLKCKHSSRVHFKTKHEYVRVKVKSPQNQDSSAAIDKELTEQKLKLQRYEEDCKLDNQEFEGNVTKLYQDLQEFQRYGCNSLIIQVTIKEMKRLRRLLDEIPGFEEVKENILKKFDEMAKVGTNPFSTDDVTERDKFIWACCMLEVDPDNLQQDDVDANFKKIDTPAVRQKQETYKYYSYAKEILYKKLTRSQHFRT